MIPIPIVIDTDNSLGELGSEVDDAFALAAAVGDPAVDLLGVTTVFGNTDAVSVADLTRDLFDGLGLPDMPIHTGAAHPMKRALRSVIRDVPDSADAVEALSTYIAERPGELVLIAIGPLTNVARLIRARPDAARQLREIVVMGGSFLRTTWRGDFPGEFNFWNDPDAVATVLESGVPLRLLGLDVTEQVRLTHADAEALTALDGPLGRLGGFATPWIEATAARRPRDPIAAQSCAMHDPLAVAAVGHPGMFEWVDAHVRIETESELTRGVIVADLLMRRDPPAANARIAVGVRTEEAKQWLNSSLRAAAVHADAPRKA